MALGWSGTVAGADHQPTGAKLALALAYEGLEAVSTNGVPARNGSAPILEDPDDNNIGPAAPRCQGGTI